jgi:hypothetical protein
MKKLGIIQSRGIGDILLALPIARYYSNLGYKILWPICEEFLPNVKDSAHWVQWIPLPTDAKGDFFYKEPKQRLKNFGCDEIICLYQSLSSSPELSNVPWFQIQKFDEFKYTKAGVPFLHKWKLADCITRDVEREDALYAKVVKQPLYYVTHTVGSSYKNEPDLSSMPAEWQRINITEDITPCVFDWLKVIEGAQALVCLDSVISNMVDQLDIKVDKYWIPRSHIHLTPVLGSEWTILDPPTDSLAAQKIFGSAQVT